MKFNLTYSCQFIYLVMVFVLCVEVSGYHRDCMATQSIIFITYIKLDHICYGGWVVKEELLDN